MLDFLCLPLTIDTLVLWLELLTVDLWLLVGGVQIPQGFIFGVFSLILLNEFCEFLFEIRKNSHDQSVSIKLYLPRRSLESLGLGDAPVQHEPSPAVPRSHHNHRNQETHQPHVHRQNRVPCLHPLVGDLQPTRTPPKKLNSIHSEEMYFSRLFKMGCMQSKCLQ